MLLFSISSRAMGQVMFGDSGRKGRGGMVRQAVRF